jgi:GntR family transcriptional regulator of arabinose operon
MDIARIKEAVNASTPAPLHEKLREAIREQVQDGTLQPGDSLPSERTMKNHFGVSRSTVRQAINALIQDEVLQSIAGTGTFVLEQTQPVTSTPLIGLITSSPNFHFFYPQLTAAFNRRLRDAGYGFVMALHNEQADTLQRMIDELLAQNVVALAITPPRYGDIRPTLERLKRDNVPVIFIGRNTPIPGIDVVATDNESIGYAATRYLLDNGHRYIVYIGLLDYSTGRERAAGYQRALEEAGLPPHIVQLTEAPQITANGASSAPREHLVAPAQDATHQLWSAGNNQQQPTAAFCFNDIVAMGVYKALRDSNRAIPGDVSLISVDNLITVRHFEIPLTTFALPGEEIGIQSAEILLRRLSGDAAAAERVLLPATFIERESVTSR